jgi:glycosyltransferase involved in cell wall biosynthesis
MCAETVFAQTFRNLEIIFVDDGSTDGSGELCDELARKDPRVRVIHQKNRGASAARNAGLETATAEYVAFLDADDELLHGAIAGLIGNIGDADAIQGLILREAPERLLPYQEECLSAREALRRALSDPTRYLLCHGWLLRRSALTERFNPALTMG